MNKINIYLFSLTNKYLIINFIIISFFIIFINLLELSRIINENEKNLLNFIYLSILKFPSILNEVVPFVTIISVTFLVRNLINNNEFVSMRNLGFSIFDIFKPIALSIFFMGLIFLIFINPVSVFMEAKYETILDKKENSLYSIKISDNQMWIKNEVGNYNSIFINIKNIDLKDMFAKDIKILSLNENANKFILAKDGEFRDNVFILKDVKYYDFKNEDYKKMDNLNLLINFNKENIINSISKYKHVPFYKYYNHTKTLNKFNLYSPEIGLYYLSEILKPIFIVLLGFIMIGFTSKFQRNENFF